MAKCRTCPHDESDHFAAMDGAASCEGGGSAPCTDPDCYFDYDELAKHSHLSCRCRTKPRRGFL